MRIHYQGRVALNAALGLTTTAFILLYVNTLWRKRAVGEEAEKELDYFTTVDSPLHSRCLRFGRNFIIADERDGDMDIAFALVVHRDPLQIARLMRMIHRKNNYYCIHADLRSNQTFVDALNGIVKCFGPNVELVPLFQLVKYLINLVGQDFPLRTILELVAALKALNGSNLIESLPIDEHRHWIGDTKLPLGTTWYKGSIYGVYRREFLKEAILGDKVEPISSIMLRHKAYQHPDELFFPTLAFNPHLKLPEACQIAPLPSSETRMNYLGKYVIWLSYDLPCNTKFVRLVCILGKEYVHLLKKAPHISPNKFYADYEQEAYNIMERWYFEKVKMEKATGSYSYQQFDPSIYARLSCSRSHL
ncbi:Beta-1,3-galactosyl-O-glycosyl-glycoprotein beta-1,6-N-acetylglucosaminyltransferase [Echinococcus granulosus]|uniref:Glycosyltransferase 14 family member n=1 Tax=Echinococcus granulosus TaxID=6210 RepID=A0A068WPU6_ECHGR|nr:Beta-1,3-galactosyl-O-glycosyl-glycoprotein beta-1,6-N-acetylglucosaminyltransferase [Echinococcus granulosus]CDS20518.1 glycosyltransferase 14 family member [Echinococcus granulosus]